MRLSEAINRADRMRPNAVPVPDKRQFLWMIETLYAEILGSEMSDWADTASVDPDLILPDQFEQIYVYWLAAFIDQYQEEIDLYQIDRLMAEQLDVSVRAYLERNSMTNSKTAEAKIKGVWI